MPDAKYENLKRLHEAEGQLTYYLAVFGDELARRQGYHELSGMEAVQFYLIHKFGWLPRDVRSMSPEDLRFVLSEEMKGWTVPQEAR